MIVNQILLLGKQRVAMAFCMLMMPTQSSKLKTYTNKVNDDKFKVFIARMDW